MSKLLSPFKKSPTDGDKDLRTLLADIEAGAEDLDRRLAAAQSAERNQAAQAPNKPNAPRFSGTGTARPQAATPETKSATEASDGPFQSSLLAELEEEASSQKGDGLTSAERRRRHAERLHEALQRIFRFFDAVAKHINKLEPAIPRVYQFDGRTAFSGLRCHEAFSDSRRQDLSENSLLTQATFRLCLMAPEPVAISRRWDQLEELKRDMHVFHLRFAAGGGINDKVRQEIVQLRLDKEIPLQIKFQADYERDHIGMLSRNLEGFGISAFVIQPDQVNQQLLDDMGRFLLGRIPQLPAALQRVHYRPNS